MAAMLYSLIRVVLDAIATSHTNEAKLRAEVLALRRQVQVLERQIKRVRWEPGDRMILAALRERLPHRPGPRCWSSRRLCWAGIANWFAGGGQRTEVSRGPVGRRWLKRSES
jgi:hypothetical protein